MPQLEAQRLGGRESEFDGLLDLIGVRGAPEDGEAAEPLRGPLLERAIGVIYRPETERVSHYFQADLAGQFDAVIHIDESRAVEPLERSAGWELGEPPETYPTAL